MDTLTSKTRPAPLPRHLLWSLWLLVLSVGFKSLNRLETDYDLWWQLFMGQETISGGAIVRTDIYSFTAVGAPIFNHEWLAQIFMAGGFQWFGDIGLLTWRWGMVLGILFFSYRLIKRKVRNEISPIIIFLCISVVLSPGVSFRPHLFTYLLLLVLLNLIDGYKEQMPFRRVVAVCGLFIAWANIHGGFVLGLLVWFLYSTGRIYRGRHTTANLKLDLMAACLPAFLTIINPYGYKLWWYVCEELGNPLSSVYITEWQRFSFAPREVPFFIVMITTWGAFIYSRKAKRFEETVSLALATLMGLVSIRHTPLFVVVALPAVAWHLDGVMLRLLSRKDPAQKTLPGIGIGVSVVLLIGALVFIRMGIPDRWKVRLSNDPLPHQSVAFLKANGLKGNLWVPLHWGGFTLFHLYPAIKVSIDGRWGMLYPLPVMEDNMVFAYKGTGGKWKEILERYDAAYALVEKGNPAFSEMLKDTDWVWVSGEESGGLLMKKETIKKLRRPLQIPGKTIATWP
jgi:hypothetical protein